MTSERGRTVEFPTAIFDDPRIVFDQSLKLSELDDHEKMACYEDFRKWIHNQWEIIDAQLSALPFETISELFTERKKSVRNFLPRDSYINIWEEENPGDNEVDIIELISNMNNIVSMRIEVSHDDRNILRRIVYAEDIFELDEKGNSTNAGRNMEINFDGHRFDIHWDESKSGRLDSPRLEVV